MIGSGPRLLDESPADVEAMVGHEELTGSTFVATGMFGHGVMTATGESFPATLDWTVPSSGGTRELWVRYACEDSRIASIFLNGALVTDSALFDSTGGWHEAQQMWWFQGNVELLAGDNMVRIVSHGYLPHIHAIAICAPSAGRIEPAGDRLRNVARAEHRKPFAGLPLPASSQIFDGLHRFYTQARASGLSNAQAAGLAGDYFATCEEYARLPSNFQVAGPFNDQALRTRLVSELIAASGATGIVETGAFMGVTTEHLARFGLPVVSCELMHRFFVMASFRLQPYKNVNIFNCDSRIMLRETFKTFPDVYRKPFFYLDAHWYDDLPFPEEVQFILDNVASYVVVVDDFQVIGSDYNYDRYENGNELTLDFLMARLNVGDRTPVFLTPSRPASEETGLRRGTLVIVSADIYENGVGGLGLLRRVEP